MYAYRDSDRWSRMIAQQHRPRRSPRPASRRAAGRRRRRRRPGRPARPAAPRPGRAGAGSATPSPLSRATAGSSTGSANGARNRITTCRPRKTAVSSAGRHPEVGRDRVEQVRLDRRRVRGDQRPCASSSSAQLGVAPGPGQAYAGLLARGGGRRRRYGGCGHGDVLGSSRAQSGDRHSAGRAPASRCRRAGRRAWWSARPARRPTRRALGAVGAVDAGPAVGVGGGRRSPTASGGGLGGQIGLQVRVRRVVAGQLGQPALARRPGCRPGCPA